MGLKAIDLFSGIGGLSLGFENAGIEVKAAYEYWKNAVTVYSHNFDHPIYDIDLSNVQNYDIFAKYDPDIIIGGPPCQDYSSAGKRNENGGRADMTIHFANIVSVIRPKYFVMENVDIISKYKTYQEAKKIFKSSGYGITEVVLNASYFNVPQSRKRFFLVGVLNGNDDDLKERLETHDLPKPMTVRDYLGDSLGIENYYRHPRNYNRRGVFSIDEPSPTVRGVNRPVAPGYVMNKNDTADPKSVRPLTTIERSYIQTFPASFDFSSEKSKTNLEQMIGNAVPVNLASHVAKVLIDFDNNLSVNKKKTGKEIKPIIVRNLGRPRVHVTEKRISELLNDGLTKTEIVKKLGISRATVYRILSSKKK